MISMQTISSHLGELPADTPIAVLCHHGGRSAQVTAFLQREGYEAHNVDGGIHRWANEIDDTLARY
jgi:rhodanese-related sulfurtransferase